MATEPLITNGAAPAMVCKMITAEALIVSSARTPGPLANQGLILGITLTLRAGVKLREGTVAMVMMEMIQLLPHPLQTVHSQP